jgi:hypothetical protein
MDIEKFIIALMAFVLVGGITLLFMNHLYSPDNLDINMSSDKDTQVLVDLDTNLASSRDDISTYNDQMESKVLSNATFKKDITSGDLLGSAWSALTNIPHYVGTFFSLIVGIAGALAGGQSATWLWFFIGIVIIGLAITVIRLITGGNVR